MQWFLTSIFTIKAQESEKSQNSAPQTKYKVTIAIGITILLLLTCIYFSMLKNKKNIKIESSQPFKEMQETIQPESQNILKGEIMPNLEHPEKSEFIGERVILRTDHAQQPDNIDEQKDETFLDDQKNETFSRIEPEDSISFISSEEEKKYTQRQTNKTEKKSFSEETSAISRLNSSTFEHRKFIKSSTSDSPISPTDLKTFDYRKMKKTTK